MSAELVIRRGDERLAWSTGFERTTWYGHSVVVATKLMLSHETALNLVARQNYVEVFSGAELSCCSGSTFGVLHSAFEMYRTGEPMLRGFAALSAVGPVKDLGGVVSYAALRLRQMAL